MTAIDSPTLLAHFHTPHQPAAQIFHHVRARFLNGESTTRQQLVRDLGLSQSTVSRLSSKLIDAHLLSEGTSTDDTPSTGRPSTVLLPDGRHLTAAGIHLGTNDTLIALFDGAGRTAAETTIDLPLLEVSSADDALGTVARHLTDLLFRTGRKMLDHVGLAISTHVPPSGLITSRAYGWEGVAVADLLARQLDVLGVERRFEQISLATGVSAMAGHELAATPCAQSVEFPSTLFFYAREVVEHAWILNDAVFRPHTGSAVLVDGSATLGEPRGEETGGEQQAYSSLSNVALLQQARGQGIEASRLEELVQLADTTPEARGLLDARADEFSRVISLALHAVDPQRIVLAGESFALDPRSVRRIARNISAGEGGAQRSISLKPASGNARREAARVTALHQLWDAPLGA